MYGKIEVFGPRFPNRGWREKIGPPDGCSGFRWSWSHSVTVVRLTIHKVSHLNYIKWIEIISHAVIQVSYFCLHVAWSPSHKIWLINSCSNSDRHYFSRRTKVFSFAQDRKRGNQKHRLRQEIPCVCRQLAHCFVQYYSQNICIAFCKLQRNLGFFCSVNHLTGPLRQQMFISKSSKGHGL